MDTMTVNPPNLWRLETPGHAGWTRTARPGDARKYFIVSADEHVNEPATLWFDRIDTQYRDRLPRVDHRRARRAVARLRGLPSRPASPVRPRGRGSAALQGGRRSRSTACATWTATASTPPCSSRTRGSPCGRRPTPSSPWRSAGSTTTGRGRSSAPTTTACRRPPPSPREISRARSRRCERVAKLGFRALTLPCKPVWGAHDVEHPELQPARLRPPLGRRPGDRAAHHLPRLDGPRPARLAGQRRGRHQLRLALARAHHRARRQPLRVRRARAVPGPPLRHDRGGHRLAAVAAHRDGRGLPEASLLGAAKARSAARASTSAPTASRRSRRIPPGLELAERHGLTDCVMWGNDYPHHEGTWPHSAEAIERTMGMLSDEQRAKALGLNAARLFKFDVPPRAA